MYKAMYLSPMVPSYNLAETSSFFRDLLGFSTVMDTPGYVIQVKDNLTIHLLTAGENIGQMEFYMEVDNVDKIWLEIKERIGGIKVREPFDRDYGMREIHIAVPQTNALMFIGHEITGNQ